MGDGKRPRRFSKRLLALLIAGGAALAWLAAATNSLRDIRRAITEWVSPSEAPPAKWRSQMSYEPVLPGVSLAGVALGLPEATALERLGLPTTHRTHRGDPKTRERYSDGPVLMYELWYAEPPLYLSVMTRRDARTVMTVRAMCVGLGSCGAVPSYRGIGFGTKVRDIRQALGPPGAITHMPGTGDQYCPRKPPGQVEVYHYEGIAFYICSDTDAVTTIQVEPPEGLAAIKAILARDPPFGLK
jgi:hypothetical protein